MRSWRRLPWGSLVKLAWRPIATKQLLLKTSHPLRAVQLWALPEVRALTAKELEASTLEEPEEDAEEAQADAAAADKAEEVRVGTNTEVTLRH